MDIDFQFFKTHLLRKKWQEPALIFAAAFLYAKVIFVVHPIHALILTLFCFYFFFDSIFLFLTFLIIGFLKPSFSIFFGDIHLFLWMKTTIKSSIFSLYPQEIANFFCTFFLGEECSFELSHTFRALGLSHLLAISGFHFQTILGTVDFFLHPLSNKKMGIYILFFIALCYVCIIEASASVLRSFISIGINLIAPLLGRFCDAKNSFYLSYFLIFLLCPKKIDSIGCTLSFLATFGILFYKNKIEKFFHMHLIRPSVYFFENKQIALKKSFFSILALNLSVFMTTTPYILITLGAYPPLSLLTNLFFPTLMVPALFLFLLSLIFPFFSDVVTIYIQKIIWIMQAIPRPLAYNISIPSELFFVLETIFILTIAIPFIRPCFKTLDHV